MKAWVVFPLVVLFGLSPGLIPSPQALVDAPSVTIVSPKNGLIVFGPDVTFTFQVTNFTLAPDEIGAEPAPGQGHMHVYVNGVLKGEASTGTFIVTGLTIGLRTVKVSLAQNDHTPLDPPVEHSVTILVL
ncbi:MAG: hypothetical protein HYY01_09585 [Chloroflexi bacterium]|nr:hypothetical protein [Chloroflexota bacterium]